jgi:ABC-type branched-subunit amino acid transport system substrate-binding protein/outer membrane protein assembly factor BamD (BamD/ComL family)
VTILTAQSQEVYFNQLSEEYFLLGMRQYSQKDFRPALQSFQRSIESYPMNHRITAAMVMEAKTHYALRNYYEASTLCDSIISRFPESLYMEDVLFTRGMCYYNMTDYLRTFDEMQRTFTVAQQRMNKEHSYRVLEHLATEFFTEQQVESAITDTTLPELKNLYLVIVAEKYFQNGNPDSAKSRLQRIDHTVADQSLQYRFNRLLSQIEKGNLVRFGVLLPLQRSSLAETREKKIASEVLEGIQFAVSAYEERMVPGQVSMELDIQDSEKDSAKIFAIISEWSKNNMVTGIIGPVFSNETIAAAKIAQEHSIPIVSPTATDEGISSRGKFVFQANSTNGAKGKTMAQYAVNVLGAKNIAVLGSAVQSSSIQADSFIVEAKRLGANIVIDRRFQKGESDLRSYVRAIRIGAANLRPDYVISLRGKINVGEVTRKLVSAGVTFSYIDSVFNAGGLINLTAFFGENAKKIADSLKLPVKRTTVYIDSLNYPVTSLDVIYCPISSGHEIGIITSQLTFYNIKASLLGSGDWNDANELDLNKRYADGVIFGSDRWIERNDMTSRLFSKYSQRYGKQISDNVLLGFDAMSMIIQQFNEGTLSREQLTELLGTVMEFPGIRNAITLKTERVNSALHILQFRNGAVSKLQTFSSH